MKEPKLDVATSRKANLAAARDYVRDMHRITADFEKLHHDYSKWASGFAAAAILAIASRAQPLISTSAFGKDVAANLLVFAITLLFLSLIACAIFQLMSQNFLKKDVTCASLKSHQLIVMEYEPQVYDKIAGNPDGLMDLLNKVDSLEIFPSSTAVNVAYEQASINRVFRWRKSALIVQQILLVFGYTVFLLIAFS